MVVSMPDKSWIYLVERTSRPFAVGCKKFLDWAFGQVEDSSRLRCPCRRCLNTVFADRETIHYHIFNWGFFTGYTVWEYHGETNDQSSDHRQDGGNVDELDDLLADVCTHISSDAVGVDIEAPNAEASHFYALLADGKRPLYSGCDNELTKLSYIVRLLHQKCLNKWTDRSMDSLIKFQKCLLPRDALVPDSYYDAKKIVKQLGLHYVKIHACRNDCILYWRQYEKVECCPTCGESRWKRPATRSSNVNRSSSFCRTKVPHKILRYFPITQRLQRLYMSRKTAKDMRWHKSGYVDAEAVSHPAGSDQWKIFDLTHPEFANDPRSVRLGLASDGFNPFGNMSTSYSIWPVVLLPYNLPPWLCMKNPFFMMTLLIPGKTSPGNDIDVYLQPLIEELKLLWDDGVQTFDAYAQQNFNLRAAVIWTINDFPAYGNLSGWRTKGKFACPCCGPHASYRSLRSKIGYVGHRRFLPRRHKWRNDDQSFDGTKERRDAPPFISGCQVLEQQEKLDRVVFGKKQKRKRDELSNWSKKSIFFELPYWTTLLVRHNLDVMHIERNVSESILMTLMGVPGKTKDTIKARCDLVDMGLRKELHPYEDGGEVRKPNAVYNFSPAEKLLLCNFLKRLTVPDGFASNIGRCVSVKDRKISGMKCHDHHIFVQRLLPIVVNSLLRKEVAEPLTELSLFFKAICNKSLNVETLDSIQKRLALTMCKLERVFPPAFFDVMMHLPIHLVDEARAAGPVQYRWMYPVERYLRTLKSYVRTNARPEGSIAESYIVDECLTFCSRYINSMETKFNRPPTNDDRKDVRVNSLSIFKGNGRAKGAAKPFNMESAEFHEVWLYILHNCDEVSPFIQEHKDDLANQAAQNVSGRHRAEFPDWFYTRVMTLHKEGGVDGMLYDLAVGPHHLITRYDTFVVNGFKFHTQSREEGLKCQNSGVVVKGDESSMVQDYYGVLTDIYKFSFIGDNDLYIFKCHWWDVLREGVGYKVDKWGVTWLNKNRSLNTVENYVLASQCEQVYYIDDMKSEQWVAVARNIPRDFYAIPLPNNDEEPSVDLRSIEEAYQEDTALVNGSLPVDLDTNNAPLLRSDFEVEGFGGRLDDVMHDEHTGMYDSDNVANVDRICQVELLHEDDEY